MQESTDNDKRRKRFLFFVCSSSTIIGVIVLFICNYFGNGIRELEISIILISIIGAAYIALIKLDSDMVIYRICSLFLCLSLAYSIPNGAGQGTSLYWLYVFPLIFFFFFGKKEGLIWFIAFSSSLFFIILLSPVFGWYSYGYPVVLRFIITYIIVAMVGYGLESSREFSNKLLEEKNQVLLQEIINRKRIEDIVRKSEEKYRMLVENSHDIIYTLNKEGKFVFVSPGWEQILGHQVSQVVGEPFQRFIHPDDIGKCEAILQKAIATGERQSGIEYRVRHLDNSWRWHVSNSVTIRTTDDENGLLEGIASDVTERKYMEEEREKLIQELQEALTKVKTLSGLLPICSCCKKIRDDKGYWNQVEEYVSEHTDARFTHGICPTCLKKYYPEFADNIINNNPKNTNTVKSSPSSCSSE